MVWCVCVYLNIQQQKTDFVCKCVSHLSTTAVYCCFLQPNYQTASLIDTARNIQKGECFCGHFKVLVDISYCRLPSIGQESLPNLYLTPGATSVLSFCVKWVKFYSSAAWITSNCFKYVVCPVHPGTSHVDIQDTNYRYSLSSFSSSGPKYRCGPGLATYSIQPLSWSYRAEGGTPCWWAAWSAETPDLTSSVVPCICVPSHCFLFWG